ncbi:MAG: 3'-5' exonuclease [Trueperaceae bacterium]
MEHDDDAARQAAATLDAHPDYRVLRRLPDRPASDGAGEPVRYGLYVDVETTGVDAAHDRIIELAMVLFGYDAQGRVTGSYDRFDQLEDPGRPIPPDVTALTGIRDEDVRERRLDEEEAQALIARAHLVVAHNAAFDRAFLESRLPVFERLPWACSAVDVPWTEEGMESRKLEWLAYRYGTFYDGHRAVHDCIAGVHVLARPLPTSGTIAMNALLDAARRTTVVFAAVGAPFEVKDLLKARGYRWRSGRKVWVRAVPDDLADEERAWLADRIYGGPSRAQERTSTAFDRYSPRTE